MKSTKLKQQAIILKYVLSLGNFLQFHIKRLHTFKSELGKFREGKFIAIYLQKTALTQGVSHILC